MWNLWNEYIGKKVRLIIVDEPFPKPKDGILIQEDKTHIWLEIDGKTTPVPFLKTTIKRVEIKDG
jgi:hypothetical protein